MQSLDASSPLPVTAVFDVYCLYKQQAERRAKVALLTQDTMGYLTHGLRRCVMHLTECLASLLSLISRPIQAAKRTRMSMLCWGRRGGARALEALRAAGKDGPINSWVGSMA